MSTEIPTFVPNVINLSKVVKNGELDVREYSWKVSRPGETGCDINGIEKIDLSLNSLRVVALHITSSIAFRELLTSMRPFFMWSQTSRVNKIEDIQLPVYLSKSEQLVAHNLRETAIGLLKENHQDIARIVIPLGSKCEYVIAMDFRSWVSFLKSLKYYLPQYHTVYGRMIEDVLDIKNLEEITYASAFQILYEEIEKETFSGSHVIVRSGKMPLYLRAQFVRHTNIQVVDNFWSKVGRKSYGIETYPYDKLIDVQFTSTKLFWDKLVSHRACFITHYEIWEHLIMNDIRKRNGVSNVIPCKGGELNCPFLKDNMARINGKDPGIPCPIITKNIDDVDKRVNLLGSSEISTEYKLMVSKLKK